jgi:hypothetical protein
VDEVANILQKMKSWAESNMSSNAADSLGRILRYYILVNYLSANKYDVKTFKDHMKNPHVAFSHFNTKSNEK